MFSVFLDELLAVINLSNLLNRKPVVADGNHSHLLSHNCSLISKSRTFYSLKLHFFCALRRKLLELFLCGFVGGKVNDLNHYNRLMLL